MEAVVEGQEEVLPERTHDERHHGSAASEGMHSSAPYPAHHVPHTNVPKLGHHAQPRLNQLSLEDRVWSNELGAMVGVLAVLILCGVWLVAWWCMYEAPRRRQVYRRVPRRADLEMERAHSISSDDGHERQRAHSGTLSPARSPARSPGKGKAVPPRERSVSPVTDPEAGSVVSLLRDGSREGLSKWSGSGWKGGRGSSFY